jgi:DnaJ-class molecular chaperone
MFSVSITILILLLLCLFNAAQDYDRMANEIELSDSIISKDLYNVLGLKSSSSITTKDIKKAYRKLAQIHHPDKV